MARPSRPPGFDMAYRPREQRFGPPPRAYVAPGLYLAVAVVFSSAVAAAHGAPGSWLHRWLLEGDGDRVVGATPAAIALVVSALAMMLRTSMRGVLVRPDGILLRDSEALLWPRVRLMTWVQIDLLVLDQPSVAVCLWDGTRAHLPRVEDRQRLTRALEKVAAARAIPVRGGLGLDDFDDLD